MSISFAHNTTEIAIQHKQITAIGAADISFSGYSPLMADVYRGV